MNEIILNNENELETESEQAIVKLLTDLEKMKKAEEELRLQLRDIMCERGLVKIENEKLSITYVPPTTSERFSSKDFKKDHPDLYDEYVKISSVSDYVKVKVK